jgi:hypothetical protein
MSDSHPVDPRLEQVLNFPLVSGLLGRRSRRFGYGMTIPSGPLAYRSAHEPLPLNELETALLVGAATGVTGWNFGIPFTVKEPESLSNYSLRLTGRTAPSAATICTTELFYTDDTGIYLTRTRDLPPERLREFEIKAAVRPYTQAQIDCIGEMAQHIYRTYGRFPVRYPTILLRIYAQAHHLELEFYDQFFDSGAYLRTHAEHMERWHTTLE